MGIRRRTFGQVGAAVIGAVTALVGAGPALAFVPLPPGGQVNDDLAAGINRALSVNGQNPTNADVVGGALTAGKVAVPWAIFRQTEASGSRDQVFSRSFAQGAWTTRGSGTVGGSSSASPVFPASLNFDQLQDGEAPAIDFAGAGRTVPWATWYENTAGVGFATNNVFASRFDNAGDANQGKWIFAGQNRGTGGTNLVPVPSLNIHTNQTRREPVGRRRLGRRPDEARAVGHVAGDRGQRARRHQEPDLRRKAAGSGSVELHGRDTSRG